MKKTCSTWTIVYLACAALMGFLGLRRIAIAAVPMAIVGGAILWLGLAYIGGIGDKVRKAALIRRAINGETPRDGQIIAAVGRMEPLDDILLSPFQRVPCVAYSYRVARPRRKTVETDYKGVGLVPSSIGPMKLLAWPNLDVTETLCSGDDLLRHAREYVAETHFIVPEMMKPTPTKSPRVRYDHKNSHPDSTLTGSMLYEAVVRPGEEVCAFGYYSAMEGGLTHEPDVLVPSLTLMNGSAGDIMRRFVRRSIGNIIGGLVCIAIAAAATIVLYANVPLAAAEQMSPNRTTFWWEVRLERLIKRHVKTDETVPTELETGRAHGRIAVGDREVRPTRCAATLRDNFITVTFDDNAASATIDFRTNTLAHLELLGTTITNDAEVEVLNVDRKWIEGRITYIGDDAKCRIAFKAPVTE